MRITRTKVPGLADVGGGHFAVLGTRAPCTCTLEHQALPWRIVKRQRQAGDEAAWHVLDARGSTRYTFPTLRAVLVRFAPAGGSLATWLDRSYLTDVQAMDYAAPIERVWHDQP